MKTKKHRLIIVLACMFFISLGLTIAVGFSNQQEPVMLVKSVTPVYDEEGSVIVNDDGVIFNDKEQEVKYNVLIENPNNYDVKVSDIKLSTPTEEFLEYDVENLKLDDVISANGTKELVVSFETVKKDGWGRNFNDELTANIIFAKSTKKDEPIPTPEPEEDNEEIKTDENEETEVEKEPVVEDPSQIKENEEEVIIPNDDLINKIEDDKKEELKEETTEKEPVEEEKKEATDKETKEKDSKKDKSVLIVVLVIVTSATGIAIVVVLVKNKNTKTIALIFVLISCMSLVYADELIELPIKFNISFESQNIMKNSGCYFDLVDKTISNCGDYWSHSSNLSNFYVLNKFENIENVVYEFDVSEQQNGRVKAYMVPNNLNSNLFDLYLMADGLIYANEDASLYFGEMINLDKIDNLSGIDTSKVTNMLGMFHRTGYNSTNFNFDLSSFDTSKVTNMMRMFYNLGYSSKNLFLDLDSFNTSNVTTMKSMFEETGHSAESLVLDLTSFDTNKVTDMTYMFKNTGYFSNELTIDISKLDTSSVIDMKYMFVGTGYKNKNFTLDVSNFNTSNVTNMYGMFMGTGRDSTVLTLDVSNFDTSNVTNMAYMFYEAGHYNTNFTLDVSSFDTSKVTDMTSMFEYAGYESTMFQTSLTLMNSNVSYLSLFSHAFAKGDSKITLNYIGETEMLVDKIISNYKNNPNIVKGKLIVDVDKLSVGDEVHIGSEKFNVISQTDDEITMLAKYNIGPDYKQSETANKLSFSDNTGWEYTPGPLEIDIDKWSLNAANYVDNYVLYLETLLNAEVDGTLITLSELKSLGCTIIDDYSSVSNGSEECYYSPYREWLANGQEWWTKSAYSEAGFRVWLMGVSGMLTYYKNTSTVGIRPVITISKETLRNM